ncbi:unnamed protein product, partial [Polarella glacialis]
VSGSAAAEPSLDKVSERRQLPLLWGIFFEADHLPMHRLRHLQDLQALPDYFRKVKDPHVTLAYAGSLASSRASLLDGAVVTGVAETALAKRHGISVEAFRRHSEDCQLWSGREVEVSISQLVQGTDGLVAAVTLPEDLPCIDKHPHMMLARSPQVGADYAAALLRTAGKSEDLTDAERRLPCLVQNLGPPVLMLRGVVRPVWGHGGFHPVLPGRSRPARSWQTAGRGRKR